MTNDIARPKIVFAAIALLALSLSFSAYAEISFALASVSAGAAPGFAIGRLLWPLLWFAVQAWVLFKLVQGRNWARILIIVFVALAVALRYVAINSPLAQLSDASTLAAAVAQTMVELVAVLLLIMAGNYFAPRASA